MVYCAMAKSFSDQVADFERKAKARALAVFQQSTMDTANMANTPRSQGGNLPVDTSFLLNSLSANIGSPPRGPSTPADPHGNPSEAIVVLARAKITDVVYVGWTAAYARAMNARYGFRDLAVQKWDDTVKKVTERAKKEIP